MGQLQNSAWSLSDTCTFKIMNVQPQNPVEKINREERPSCSGASLCKLLHPTTRFQSDNLQSYSDGFKKGSTNKRVEDVLLERKY